MARHRHLSSFPPNGKPKYLLSIINILFTDAVSSRIAANDVRSLFTLRHLDRNIYMPPPTTTFATGRFLADFLEKW